MVTRFALKSIFVSLGPSNNFRKKGLLGFFSYYAMSRSEPRFESLFKVIQIIITNSFVPKIHEL